MFYRVLSFKFRRFIRGLMGSILEPKLEVYRVSIVYPQGSGLSGYIGYSD